MLIKISSGATLIIRSTDFANLTQGKDVVLEPGANILVLPDDTPGTEMLGKSVPQTPMGHI